MFNPFKRKKLCKHDYEYIDKEQVTSSAMGMIDMYYLDIYQCKHCLKVKKLMHILT